MMSLVIVGIVVLLGGSAVAWRRGDRQRAVLMAVAALVIAGNVAIWSVPMAPAGH